MSGVAMELDQPLDALIQKKRADRKGNNNNNRKAGARNGPAATTARARYSGNVPKANNAPAPAQVSTAQASKIIISNLPHDVTEAAVRDLMQSTIGPVRSVQMSYTSTGKSTGVATVLFKNKGDGNKAHATYHNRKVDDQRPMKVELAFDPASLVSLASRVATPPAPQAARSGAAGPSRRGGRGPRGAGGSTRPPRPAKKTAEELDAEMAAYKDTPTA